jgi:uncharacterized membrane protein
VPVGRDGISGGLLFVLGGLVPVLIYHLSFATQSAMLTGIAVAVQVTAIAWIAAGRLPNRYRAAVALAGLAAVAALLLGLGLPARSAGLAVGGACHAVAYTSLLVWFAASLRVGHEPVVTGFARRMRRTMPAKVVRYTRHVTVAWSAFFAAQLLVSAALLAAAPSGLWASFVNVWSLPLVVAMFLAEFACRLVLFRQEPRTGLFATLAGLRHSGGSSANRP